MIPPAKHGGRNRTIDVREIVNGIFYVLSTGCQWQALPNGIKISCTLSSEASVNLAPGFRTTDNVRDGLPELLPNLRPGCWPFQAVPVHAAGTDPDDFVAVSSIGVAAPSFGCCGQKSGTPSST